MGDRRLGRGENTTLSAEVLTVAVTGPAVDVVAFVLRPDRTVRTDADFVFYNNPQSPSGKVTLTGPATLTVDLRRIPAEIERIAVGISIDPPATLGGARIDTTVTAGDTTIVAPAEGLTVERAAVLVEIYRRGGDWKLRSESAGWEAGFAALVREHGVAVDDEPAAVGSPASAPTTTSTVSSWISGCR
ncbi:TerD family protein [Gordonia desulfuricans]|uniref:TerD family protein n=1 Tax=Gordonia desulfuricans TaxID=89051 RepID=A0A7K3LS47_9ACTN|nr:TerD family protein [Gordonia desulfuricans]NDK91078.1 TerD family protein [Gordonia desulfuricans]